jgi:hypothetical protein
MMVLSYKKIISTYNRGEGKIIVHILDTKGIMQQKKTEYLTIDYGAAQL